MPYQEGYTFVRLATPEMAKELSIRSPRNPDFDKPLFLSITPNKPEQCKENLCRCLVRPGIFIPGLNVLSYTFHPNSGGGTSFYHMESFVPVTRDSNRPWIALLKMTNPEFANRSSNAYVREIRGYYGNGIERDFLEKGLLIPDPQDSGFLIPVPIGSVSDAILGFEVGVDNKYNFFPVV
jgi:hypothetical protein